jgi:hypothetical protein
MLARATPARAIAAPRRRATTTMRATRARITTIASATKTPEARASDAQRWIDAWKDDGATAKTTPADATGEADRELREGELAVKKGLLGTFIKAGEKEVTAEDYRKFQAEIAAKKAEAQRKMKEARANKKGPFGLW